MKASNGEGLGMRTRDEEKNHGKKNKLHASIQKNNRTKILPRDTMSRLRIYCAELKIKIVLDEISTTRLHKIISTIS